MIVQGIKTGDITSNSGNLYSLLEAVVTEFPDDGILAITSKVVSLREGSVIDISEVGKETLIEREAEFYLPKTQSKYGVRFTITNSTLIPTSGIDESNSNGMYLLWPKDSQQTANHALWVPKTVSPHATC